MSVTDWAVGVIEAMGGPGVALVLALTSGFPPIPGELLLPFVGVTAAVRGPGWWWGVAWTTAGSPAGALGLYGAGRPVGERRVRALIARVPSSEAADADVATAWFARHGGRSSRRSWEAGAGTRCSC